MITAVSLNLKGQSHIHIQDDPILKNEVILINHWGIFYLKANLGW